MNEDAIMRTALGNPAAVPRLLSLLPPDVGVGLDANRLRRLPAEYVARGGRKRAGDIAWAIGVDQDPDAEALLVVECQSSTDRRMALRMLVYNGLLWQALAETPRYRRRELPLALRVVVYTGGRRWRPKTLRELLRKSPPGLARRSPDVDFELLDAGRLTADDARSNWLAALLRLLHCRLAAQLPARSKALFDGLRADKLDDLAAELADMLMRMFIFRFMGENAKEEHEDHLALAARYLGEPTVLEEAITEWRQAAIAEGLAEGRTQGIAEGRSQGMAEERALLRRLAARRFGADAGNALHALLGHEDDSERLATIGDLVVDAANGDELLRRGRSVLGHGNGG